MHDQLSDLQRRVIAIVAETLDRDVAAVRPDSSLLDDLGAESIDFLDLVFRVESAFGIKVPEQDMWRGALADASPAELPAAVAALRERMPGFRWDRFPREITKDDLPRLVTVQTIVDYLERRGVGAPENPA